MSDRLTSNAVQDTILARQDRGIMYNTEAWQVFKVETELGPWQNVQNQGKAKAIVPRPKQWASRLKQLKACLEVRHCLKDYITDSGRYINILCEDLVRLTDFVCPDTIWSKMLIYILISFTSARPHIYDIGYVARKLINHVVPGVQFNYAYTNLDRVPIAY
jgi:hypothetical protein